MSYNPFAPYYFVAVFIVGSLSFSQGSIPSNPPPQPQTVAPAPVITPGAANPTANSGPNPVPPPSKPANQQVDQTKPGAPINAATAQKEGVSAYDAIDEILEDFEYDPVNKRDPFAPYAPPKMTAETESLGPFFPLQRYNIDDLRVIGVIWDIKEPKAMVKDPTGKSHTLTRGSMIGNRNGKVAQIREGEVIVVEAIQATGRVVYQTRVLKVSRDSKGGK